MELILGSQQTGILVNKTRAVEALSHLLDNPRRTIIQVEALVTLAAALLFLQLILATWKRRWHNSIVSFVLSVCNASLLPLVFYTLSTMQSSPVKNSMYPVWGASLLMAAGGTIAVKQFDVDKKKTKNKVLMEFVTGISRYLFYFVMLSMLLVPYSLKESFYIKSLQHSEKRHSSAVSTCISYLLLGHYLTKVFEIGGLIIWNGLLNLQKKNANDHQNDTGPDTKKGKNDHQDIIGPDTKKGKNDHQDGIGADTKKGENYPIGYKIHCLSQPKVQVVTIDQIWDSCGNSGRGKNLREVCLSLALCQSLTRRFMGFSSEASHPASHDSFFKELLLIERHYERAFRIIEVELGFCYDVFFTKYQSIYFGTILYFPLFLLRVIPTTIILVLYAIQEDPVTILTPNPIVQVQITRADYIITLVLLGTALMVEILQALVYLASDWIKVSLACVYVKYKQIAFPEKLIGFLSRVVIFSRRRNRIAQYTVTLPDKFSFRFRFKKFTFISVSKCNLDPVEISPEIEKAIGQSIEPTFGEQTNRLALQVRNSMFEHLALKDHWTLKDHSQVEIMLIWHIATDYCHHLSPSSGDGSNPDRGVAVTLSRYCAYLLEFVPQLLPYNAPDIRELIDTVKKERDDNLQSSGPSERYQEMQRLVNDPRPTTVFRKGVKLGKELENMPDEAQRWKAMADFWAKTIIYIAPSHITAKEHMRQLENGGEFLTHIWALLSHAGILDLVRDDNEVAMPAQAQPTQETV